MEHIYINYYTTRDLYSTARTNSIPVEDPNVNSKAPE